LNKIMIFGKDIEDIGFIFLCILSSFFLFIYDPYDIYLPFVCKSPILYVSSITLLFLMYLKCNIQKEGEVNILPNKAAAIYAALILISSFFSKYQELVYFGHMQRLEGCLALLSYIIIYFAALNLIKTKRIYALLHTLLASSSIVALIGVLEFYGHNPFMQAFKVIRKGFNYKGAIYSTIGNQNFIGSLMCLALLLSMILFILGKNKLHKSFFFIYSLCLYSGLIVTRTRSAWIGTFLGSGILLFILLRHKMLIKVWKSVILVAICFTVITFSISITSEGRIGNKFLGIFKDFIVVAQGSEDIEQLGSNRIYIWKNSIPLLREYYLIGSGPDTFSRVFPQNQEAHKRIFGNPDITIDKAHNEFIQIGVTTGIFSLFAYLSFICMIIYSNGKVISKLNLSNTYDIIILATGIGCAGYILQSFFNISVVAVAPIYWMVIGLNQNLLFKFNQDTLFIEDIKKEQFTNENIEEYAQI